MARCPRREPKEGAQTEIERFSRVGSALSADTAAPRTLDTFYMRRDEVPEIPVYGIDLYSGPNVNSHRFASGGCGLNG